MQTGEHSPSLVSDGALCGGGAYGARRGGRGCRGDGSSYHYNHAQHYTVYSYTLYIVDHEFVFLIDLQRDREYLIRMQALTVNGSGPASSWLSEETFAHDRDGNC